MFIDDVVDEEEDKKSLERKLKVEDRKDDEQIRRQNELENKEARKRRKR